METLEQIKKLLENANEIKSLFEKKIPLWNKNREHYDKTRVGFVEGGSNGWYASCETNVHFAAWCGIFGDSSTYKQIDLDGEIFRKHFMKYLNNNKQAIMMEIAESIEREAKELKLKAEGELNEELSKLKQLDNLIMS